MGWVTRLFPLWALMIAVLAAVFSAEFVKFQPAIVSLLGLVMFGMGMTLTAKHFAMVLQRPWIVMLGVTLQFVLMPLIAWLLSTALDLSLPIAVGLILVGSSPGGTASNVICYLAKGNVALSITLTSVTTVLAVFMMPFLTWFYVGKTVPVPVWEMLLSILKIIIVPVTLGVVINTYFGARLEAVKRVFPLISVLAIVIIIGIIVALNEAQLRSLAGPVVTVVLHNLIGLAGGYWLAKALGCDSIISRTLAIEVGMQNSGLAVVLAVKYFSPVAALPGAIFSIWHNLSGALLASIWARRAN
ncbi:MAG: bile acid:sodium symporter family protein [Gammaproteobacteria bacterium]